MGVCIPIYSKEHICDNQAALPGDNSPGNHLMRTVRIRISDNDFHRGVYRKLNRWWGAFRKANNSYYGLSEFLDCFPWANEVPHQILKDAVDNRKSTKLKRKKWGGFHLNTEVSCIRIVSTEEELNFGHTPIRHYLHLPEFDINIRIRPAFVRSITNKDGSFVDIQQAVFFKFFSGYWWIHIQAPERYTIDFSHDAFEPFKFQCRPGITKLSRKLKRIKKKKIIGRKCRRRKFQLITAIRELGIQSVADLVKQFCEYLDFNEDVVLLNNPLIKKKRLEGEFTRQTRRRKAYFFPDH